MMLMKVGVVLWVIIGRCHLTVLLIQCHVVRIESQIRSCLLLHRRVRSAVEMMRLLRHIKMLTLHWHHMLRCVMIVHRWSHHSRRWRRRVESLLLRYGRIAHRSKIAGLLRKGICHVGHVVSAGAAISRWLGHVELGGESMLVLRVLMLLLVLRMIVDRLLRFLRQVIL